MMAIGGVMLALSQDARLALGADRRDADHGDRLLPDHARAMPLFQQMQIKIDRLNLVLDEGLTGVRVIRAFDRDAHESRASTPPIST